MLAAASGSAECNVFVQASGAAGAYSDVALANLKLLTQPSRTSAPLQRFDTRRMANALQRNESGETLHYVLYSVTADRKLDPISLNMLWSIHSNIVFVNLQPDQKSPPQDAGALRERCEGILVDSQLLAEVFAYTAAVCSAGLGPKVVQFLQQGAAAASPGSSGDPARSALLQLSERHKAAVRAIVPKLLAAFPGSKVIAGRAKAFVPVDLPVWTTVKDHAGARVINDVWFPREFAEPLLKSLAEQQARAMTPR